MSSLNTGQRIGGGPSRTAPIQYHGLSLVAEGELLPTYEEREAKRLEEEARAKFLSAAKSNPVRLDVDAVCVCTADFPATLEGAPCTVKKGSRALGGSEAVRQAPENWKPERR